MTGKIECIEEAMNHEQQFSKLVRQFLVATRKKEQGGSVDMNELTTIMLSMAEVIADYHIAVVEEGGMQTAPPAFVLCGLELIEPDINQRIRTSSSLHVMASSILAKKIHDRDKMLATAMDFSGNPEVQKVVDFVKKNTS